MKHLLLLSIILSISINIQSQQTGGFADFNEFVTSSPSLEFDFIVKQRTKGNVFMTGGITNYRLKKIKPESYILKVEEEIWGVFEGDSIYINSYPYSKRKGYNKLIEIGYYTFFIGEPAGGVNEQRELGFIGPDDDAVQVCCKVGFVLFLDGEIKLLTPGLLNDMVADNSDIAKKANAADFQLEEVLEMFKIISEYNQAKE